MTPSVGKPLQFPLAAGVFPIAASVLFMSLWPFSSGASFGTLCQAHPVLLPSVDWAPRAPETPYDSYIHVDSDGMVFLNAKWFPVEEFPVMFRLIARESLPHAGSRVYLSVDRVTPFRTVRALLGHLREIGIGEATLLVESRNPYASDPAPNPGMQRTRYARR